MPVRSACSVRFTSRPIGRVVVTWCARWCRAALRVACLGPDCLCVSCRALSPVSVVSLFRAHRTGAQTESETPLPPPRRAALCLPSRALTPLSARRDATASDPPRGAGRGPSGVSPRNGVICQSYTKRAYLQVSHACVLSVPSDPISRRRVSTRAEPSVVQGSVRRVAVGVASFALHIASIVISALRRCTSTKRHSL